MGRLETKDTAGLVLLKPALAAGGGDFGLLIAYFFKIKAERSSFDRAQASRGPSLAIPSFWRRSSAWKSFKFRS